MRLSVLPTAAVAVVCAFALSACGGEGPEPAPLDTPAKPASASPKPSSAPSATPKPTAKPSPTGPVVQTGGGQALDAATKAEAKTFVASVLKAIDKGANTGDFSAALALFDQSCTSCKDGIKYAQGIYAKKQKIVGGQYENPKYSVSPSPLGDAVVRVDSTVAGYKIVDANGKTIRRADAEPDTSNYHLKKSSSGWHVVQWSYS